MPLERRDRKKTEGMWEGKMKINLVQKNWYAHVVDHYLAEKEHDTRKNTDESQRYAE